MEFERSPSRHPKETDTEAGIARYVKGLLTKDAIVRLRLIKESAASCFKPASYDLRGGKEYFRPTAKYLEKRQVDPGPEIMVRVCNDNERITISAFSSLLVSTWEVVDLPKNITGRFDLRIRYAIRGLVFQNGTQVEPGYRGHLFALLHNITNEDISFAPGHERLFTIEFECTSGPVDEIDDREIMSMRTFIGDDSIKGSLKDFSVELREAAAATVAANKSAKESMAKRTEIHWSFGVLIVTVLLSMILPLLINKTNFDRDDYPLVTANELAAEGSAFDLRSLVLMGDVNAIPSEEIQDWLRIEAEYSRALESGPPSELRNILVDSLRRELLLTRFKALLHIR